MSIEPFGKPIPKEIADFLNTEEPDEKGRLPGEPAVEPQQKDILEEHAIDDELGTGQEVDDGRDQESPEEKAFDEKTDELLDQYDLDDAVTSMFVDVICYEHDERNESLRDSLLDYFAQDESKHEQDVYDVDPATAVFAPRSRVVEILISLADTQEFQPFHEQAKGILDRTRNVIDEGTTITPRSLFGGMVRDGWHDLRKALHEVEAQLKLPTLPWSIHKKAKYQQDKIRNDMDQLGLYYLGLCDGESKLLRDPKIEESSKPLAIHKFEELMTQAQRLNEQVVALKQLLSHLRQESNPADVEADNGPEAAPTTESSTVDAPATTTATEEVWSDLPEEFGNKAL